MKKPLLIFSVLFVALMLQANEPPSESASDSQAPQTQELNSDTPPKATDEMGKHLKNDVEYTYSDYQPDWDRYSKIDAFGKIKDEQPEWVDTSSAEQAYLHKLNMEIPDSKRKKLLMEMAQMLEDNNNRPKAIAVYEKYIEHYPNDEAVPELYMRLGFLYREMGATEMALSKFYSVLNSSLKVNKSNLTTYKLLSLKAQLEIADTFYMQGNYNRAAEFFDRLRRLNLYPADRAQAEFKYAYSKYLLKENAEVIGTLTSFIKEYPKNPLIPESYFLLADSYKRLGQPREALKATLELLKNEQQKSGKNQQSWLYWKRRTGNQIANEFYEQGDYLNALKIYQTMVPLNNGPHWQWPLIYQIGLCYEHLRMLPKAMEAYALIADNESLPESNQANQSQSSHSNTPQSLSQNTPIESILELAIWRKEHIKWLISTDIQLNQLLKANPETLSK